MVSVKKRVTLGLVSAVLSCSSLHGALHAQPPGTTTPPTRPPTLSPTRPATPPDYVYTAETSEVARRQGSVTVGNTSWSCQGTRCVARSPSPVPAVSDCHALARQVGHIKAFGHVQRRLGVEEVRQCNLGVAAAGTGPPSPQPAPGAGAPAGVPAGAGPIPRPGAAARIDFEGRHAKPQGPVATRATAGAALRIDFEGRQAKSAAPARPSYVPGPAVRIDYEGSMARPPAPAR